MTDQEIINIAVICHQANKALCEVGGDITQKDWAAADQWQRDSAIKGVRFAVENPNAPDSSQHDAWSEDKFKEGWVWGEVKDPVLKTHPCLIPFEQLPKHQQQKDTLFRAVVKAMSV